MASKVGLDVGTVVGGGKMVVTSDNSRIEGWDVDGDEDGTTTTAHIRDELARHLPAGWEITTFDPWGPHRTNHGGAIHYQIHLTHESGAEIQLRPETTWPDNGTKTVYNSHKITKVGFNGSRDVVVPPQAMVRASHPAAVFRPLVDLTTTHQTQQTLSKF